MHCFQALEKLQRQTANTLSERQIDAIMLCHRQQRVMPLGFHALAHGGAGVVVGHHLRQ